MNAEQMRARLQEILARVTEIKKSEGLDETLTNEVNALHTEFETIKAELEAVEKIEAMTVAAGTSTKKVVNAVPRVEVSEPRNAKFGGFESSGDFFRSVRNAARGNVDKRLNVQGSAFEKYGEDGGFLVPEDVKTEISRKVTGDQSLLAMTSQFRTGSNQLVLPVNEVAPWDGSGIQAYWEGEGGTYRDSKDKFQMSQLRLHKLTALVKVSEELLEDAPALDSWIRMQAPDAILHKVNEAIISGDGVGKPLGFLNSTFGVSVAKESAQTADTIVFENIVKMEARLLPASYARAVWLINPAVKEQLRLMAFDKAATSKVPAYMPPSGLDAAPYGTLMGRPVYPMLGGMRALGDLGDIALVDLKYYITALKTSGIRQDVSMYTYWDQDLVGYKFSLRIAGQCPYKLPVTTQYGNYSLSGFVTLAERA